MKTLAAICLLLASLHARADFIIVESTDVDYAPKLLETIKIKGDKARQELGPVSITLMDFSTGEVIMMSPIGKSFAKMSAQEAKEKFGKGHPIPSMQNAWPSGRVKFTDTGKKEKVAGVDTEVYTGELGESKITLWVTRDIPHYADIVHQMKKIWDKLETPYLDTSDIDGLPLKTAVEWSGGNRVSTIVSVKELSLDDAEFQVPPGYTPRP